MKRIRDCLNAPVIPEAKLVLVAMISGRLRQATIHEVCDIIEETLGVVDYAFQSLRVAGINTSTDTSRIVLASDWVNDSKLAEVSDGN